MTCPEGSRLLSGGPEWSSGTNGTAISLAVPDKFATALASAGAQGQLLLIAPR